MKKLYKDKSLILRDIEKLKTATSIFDVVPISIQTPFFYMYLRILVKPRSVPATIKTMCLIMLFHSPILASSLYIRDSLYFPIIKSVIIDIRSHSKYFCLANLDIWKNMISFKGIENKFQLSQEFLKLQNDSRGMIGSCDIDNLFRCKIKVNQVNEIEFECKRCIKFTDEWVHPMVLNMYKENSDSIGNKIRRTIYYLYYHQIYEGFDNFMVKMDKTIENVKKKGDIQKEVEKK